MYRFLVPGWSAKPLVSAHDRIMGTHTEFVMAQLEDPERLAMLPDATTRALVTVLMETGLRAGDACSLPFTPIIEDSAGWPCLRYFNTKMAAEQLVPLSAAAAEAIRAQQTHLLNRWPDAVPVLFPAPHSNPDGTRPFSYATLRGVGAGNSAVAVDLPRCGPMLSPRVPNLVPIPGPRMERETPGQRPRPNYGHPQGSTSGWTGNTPAVRSSATRMMWSSTATPSNRPNNSAPISLSGSGLWALSCIPTRRRSCTAKTRSAVTRRSTPASTFSATPSGVAWPVADEASS